MSIRDRLAAVMYGAVALASLGMGVYYVTSGQFTSYHQRAVGVPWDALPAGERELILALMRLGAAGFLAVGVALALLLVRYCRHEPWTRWAIPAVGLTFWVPVFVTTVVISENTPAAAPWPGSLTAVAVLVVAAVLSPPGRAATSTPAAGTSAAGLPARPA